MSKMWKCFCIQSIHFRFQAHGKNGRVFGHNNCIKQIVMIYVIISMFFRDNEIVCSIQNYGKQIYCHGKYSTRTRAPAHHTDV